MRTPPCKTLSHESYLATIQRNTTSLGSNGPIYLFIFAIRARLGRTMPLS